MERHNFTIFIHILGCLENKKQEKRSIVFYRDWICIDGDRMCMVNVFLSLCCWVESSDLIKVGYINHDSWTLF